MVGEKCNDKGLQTGEMQSDSKRRFDQWGSAQRWDETKRATKGDRQLAVRRAVKTLVTSRRVTLEEREANSVQCGHR